MAKGLVERIGIEGSKLTHKVDGKDKCERGQCPCKDHTEALMHGGRGPDRPEHGRRVTDMDEIGAVGHRVLHGGEKFTASRASSPTRCMDAIEENIPLAPAAQPRQPAWASRPARRSCPARPMVAVFDTAFHQTMPPKAYLYGVPYEYYEQYCTSAATASTAPATAM